MKNRRPFAITASPAAASSPSSLLSELEAMLVARPRLVEEREKVEEKALTHKLHWTKELAREAATNVNMQSLVSRFRDLQTKEQDFDNQRNSLARALHEIDSTVQHYKQKHRQDLLQAMQTRLDHMSEPCKEYDELTKQRDALLKEPEVRSRGSRRGAPSSKAKGDD